MIVLVALSSKTWADSDLGCHPDMESNSVCTQRLPVINIDPLRTGASTDLDRKKAVDDIASAIRTVGFFYIVGHGVPEKLQNDLVEMSSDFFANATTDEKDNMLMSKGGKAWRGYFSVGDEFTSGIPDEKEGIYFGSHSEVVGQQRLLHGSNLYHSQKMKSVVEQYMQSMKELGSIIMSAIEESLNLPPSAPRLFTDEDRENPTQLFRIFHYPPHQEIYGDRALGVGTHSDYGYITILKQDNQGGLQVQAGDSVDEWIDATPIENSFIINLGDALERMTGGLIRATPHRVKQRKDALHSRYSFPFFFDPSFDSKMVDVSEYLTEADKAIALSHKTAISKRWDAADPTLFQGTYGDYLISKVKKVFPALASEVIEG